MKGRITIESREDFDRWLETMYARQEATQPEPEPAEAVAQN
jgi:heme/copper-type cytochrome/quinol oxidase subunit 2